MALLARWLGLSAHSALHVDASDGKSYGEPVPIDASGTGLAPRIIPCLDVHKGRVVKGTRFLSLKDMGQPEELAARYASDGADELVVLDISAGIDGRTHDCTVIRAVRSAINLPLCAGGGIRSLADAESLFASGADKVSVNSQGFMDHALVRGIAHEFGSQACVVAVDATRGPDGRAIVVLNSGTSITKTPVSDWIHQAAELGAGEFLITSRDRDGTRDGYDLALLKEAKSAAGGVPVIASGGAGKPEHLLEGLRAGADAVLLAGILHDGRESVTALKRCLAVAGERMRS